uniref:Syntaxin 6/10/61 N-terminal domain-containing protein n=2 Tax=Lotharella globosa TaxID=91324 RepID=A0A7S3ZBL5_9EUKA
MASDGYEQVEPNSPVDDPFHIVKERIQVSVRQLEADMATWRELLKRTNTNINAAFQRLTRSAKSQLKHLKANTRKLNATITAVESQRSRFPGIDDIELADRKQFVTQTRAVIDGYQKLLVDPATKAKKAEDRRKVAQLRGATMDTFASTDFTSGEFERTLAEQQQQQEEMEEKQDMVLDDMSTALQRLALTAEGIDCELAEHKELIQDLDAQVDRARGRMDVVVKGLEMLLGVKGGNKIICLALMFLMVFILLGIAIFG